MKIISVCFCTPICSQINRELQCKLVFLEFIQYANDIHFHIQLVDMSWGDIDYESHECKATSLLADTEAATCKLFTMLLKDQESMAWYFVALVSVVFINLIVVKIVLNF